MIEILGWVSTAMILLGAFVNAKGFYKYAMIIWIIGDIGWIMYDIYIHNISHMFLSLVIIGINSFGIHRIWKQSSQNNKSDNELKN